MGLEELPNEVLKTCNMLNILFVYGCIVNFVCKQGSLGRQGKERGWQWQKAGRLTEEA